MNHRRLVLVGVVTALAIIGATIFYRQNRLKALENPAIPAIQAKTAFSFGNSVGMNVHAHQWTAGETTTYINALRDLNISHVRDEIQQSYADYINTGNGFGTNWVARLQQFHQQAGIDTSLITAESGILPAADVVSYVKLANTVSGTIGRVEGPNEVDSQCAPTGTAFTAQIYFDCPEVLWRNRTEAYATSVYNALKADAATRGVTIYSPSIGLRNAGLGLPVFKNTSDAGNFHYYQYLSGDQITTVGQQLAKARLIYGSHPIAITEDGVPESQCGNTQARATSEQVQAAMLPAILLEDYLAGIERTYLYQLVDDRARQDCFGLINNLTGQKKPAFTALQNLLGLLKDTPANFSPTALRYQLTGQTAGVSSLLLQKQDGRFYLVLWQTSLAQSPALLPSQTLSAKNIGVQFGNSISTIKSYQPTVSPSSNQTFNQPTEISGVNVAASPVVLEITPASGSSSSSSSGGNSSSTSGGTGGSTKSTAKKIGSSTPTALQIPANPSVTAPAVNPDFLLPGVANQPSSLSFWQRTAAFFGRVFSWVGGFFH